MRLRRRHGPLRRFARPGRPSQPPSGPLDIVPVEDKPSGESTEFAIVSIPGAASPSTPKSHDSTAELPSVVPTVEEDDKGTEIPVPPDRLEYKCPCGADLVATLETYDKRSRCGTCQTVLLQNLVYDPETGKHEIVPFEVTT
jgi:hypothetical protein